MIEINDADEVDQAQIIWLAEQAFGINYLKPEHFKPPWRFTFLVAVDADTGDTVGFACCSINRGKGMVDDVVVAENHKRLGIGTTLVSLCLSHLWQMGAITVESNAWEYIDSKKVPLGKALEKNGFERVKYLYKFYHRPGESDHECILCGYPCKCSAFLYRRTLDNTPPEVL